MFYRRSLIVRSALCATLFGLCTATFACGSESESVSTVDAGSPAAPIEPTLASYYADIGEVLGPYIGDLPLPPPGQNAKEMNQILLASYVDLEARFAALTPPPEAEAVHQQYLDALDRNLSAYAAAVERTPADAPTERSWEYLFSDTRMGYAFVAETNAKCALNDLFYTAGFAPYDFLRFCNPTPVPAAVVGSSDAPVNDVTIIHETYPNPAYPNLWYAISDIYASSAEPIRIVFDNRNPPPFVFNLAIYEGNPESLEGLSPIAATASAPGQKVHELVLELDPGTYSYTDNVHPYGMRGVLRVVE